MGRNEVGYLKGVLTRSGTYSVARQIERNWKIRREDDVSFDITVSQRRMVEVAAIHMICTNLRKETQYISF